MPRRRQSDASVRTVVVAVVVNLAIAVAKGVAAALTGSAALWAETAHSAADTGNEILLFIGVRRSARPPDRRHPFGYGQERYSWLTARRQLRRESAERGRSVPQHMSRASDPTASLVFLEDSAALIGLALALAAIGLHWWTGEAWWDAAASIAIGVLLVGVAYAVARRSKTLLIDEAVPPDVLVELRRVLLGSPVIVAATVDIAVADGTGAEIL